MPLDEHRRSQQQAQQAQHKKNRAVSRAFKHTYKKRRKLKCIEKDKIVVVSVCVMMKQVAHWRNLCQ
jgi:hypothetical protein